MASSRINLSPFGDEQPDPERLRRELDECEDRALRLRADFDNFRRRVERERAGAAGEGRRAALLAILPVLDSLERGLAAGSSDRAFYTGIAATHTLFLDALREAGAVPIESVGKPFDPTVHEGVGTATAAGVAPGTVVRDLRTGWLLGGDLLRPAQVIVSAAAGARS
jgi:molecular chaperone GrpE